MNKSFKTPAGLLAATHLDDSPNAGNHIGKSADGACVLSNASSGAPIQPMLPSGYPMPKMVERESTGVQCPSATAGQEGTAVSPALVH